MSLSPLLQYNLVLVIAVEYAVKIQSFSETRGSELEEGKLEQQHPLRGAQLRTDSWAGQSSLPKNLPLLPSPHPLLHCLHFAWPGTHLSEIPLC